MYEIYSRCGSDKRSFEFEEMRKVARYGSNFELVFVSRIPQIRLKKSVTEIL